MSVRKQSAMKKNGEENLRRQSIILVEFCNKNLILCLIDCHLLRRRETWFEVSILTCFSPFLLKSEHDRECELWKCIMSFHLGERERLYLLLVLHHLFLLQLPAEKRGHVAFFKLQLLCNLLYFILLFGGGVEEGRELESKRLRERQHLKVEASK